MEPPKYRKQQQFRRRRHPLRLVQTRARVFGATSRNHPFTNWHEKQARIKWRAFRICQLASQTTQHVPDHHVSAKNVALGDIFIIACTSSNWVNFWIQTIAFSCWKSDMYVFNIFMLWDVVYIVTVTRSWYETYSFHFFVYWPSTQNLGFGYDTYKKFFESVPKAELHTIEISCIEQGPREEGKWPWDNFAKENKEYESLLDQKLLVSNELINQENWTEMTRRTEFSTDLLLLPLMLHWIALRRCFRRWLALSDLERALV